MFAVVVDVIKEHHFDVHHATLLCASSLITAAIASLVLGMQSFISICLFLLLQLYATEVDNFNQSIIINTICYSEVQMHKSNSF